MSTKTGKKPGFGLYLLPLAVAVPAAACMTAVVFRLWPTIHKLLNILVKMVVKA